MNIDRVREFIDGYTPPISREEEIDKRYNCFNEFINAVQDKKLFVSIVDGDDEDSYLVLVAHPNFKHTSEKFKDLIHNILNVFNSLFEECGYSISRVPLTTELMINCRPLYQKSYLC